MAFGKIAKVAEVTRSSNFARSTLKNDESEHKLEKKVDRSVFQDDKVTISGADRIGSLKRADDIVQASSNSDKDSKVAQEIGRLVNRSLLSLNPNLRADYTVNDSGEVIIKVLEKVGSEEEVVKEIPPEGQQRIREFIHELIDSSGYSVEFEKG